jgi:4-amino-4-deoxy-L-arabinose transferase-like glycosyltransferase
LRWWLVIVLLALVIRLAVVVGWSHFTPIADSITYDRMAVTLVDHHTLPGSAIVAKGPTAFPPPLFPIAVAAAYEVVGTDSQSTRLQAGRVLEALLGTVAVALIYAIARRVFSRPVALLAAGIAAIYPPLILVGSSLMSESLFIPLMLGAVLAALMHRESERRWSWLIVSGVLIALCALTRSNGIVLLIPIGFLVWTERPRLRRSALRAPLTLIATTVIALLPWTIRNTVAFHQFVPITTETGYALAGTYNDTAAHDRSRPTLWIPPIPQAEALLQEHPGFNEAQLGDRLLSQSLDYVSAHPAYPLRVAMWSALRLFNLTGPGFERWSARWEGYPPDLAVWSVWGFYIAAIFMLIGFGTAAFRRAPWALWCCPLAILLSTLLFAGLTRYRSPADPWIVILAALGLAAAWRQRPGPRVPSPGL